MSALEDTRQFVAARMNEILARFKAGAKITVLVRFSVKPRADTAMSGEDLSGMIAPVPFPAFCWPLRLTHSRAQGQVVT